DHPQDLGETRLHRRLKGGLDHGHGSQHGEDQLRGTGPVLVHDHHGDNDRRRGLDGPQPYMEPPSPVPNPLPHPQFLLSPPVHSHALCSKSLVYIIPWAAASVKHQSGPSVFSLAGIPAKHCKHRTFPTVESQNSRKSLTGPAGGGTVAAPLKGVIVMSLKTKLLDRDAIKLIAIVLMLGNHIAAVFLPLGVFPWQIISDLGYFTAITMCCFLVEGYRHTRSRKKYALRLLVFALLSQFP